MAKKKRMQILGGYITHLSLCPAGANNISTVYKAADGKDTAVTFSVASKAKMDLGEVYSLVYVPNKLDLQDDFANTEAIKSLAYSFSQAGAGIDVVHNEKVLPKEDIFVAETMLFSETNKDARFADIKDYDGNPVDLTGGWGVVLKIHNEEIKELYRSGKWQGVSMGGMVATREVPEDVSVTKTKPIALGEDDIMDAKELQALLDGMVQANKTLVTDIVSAIAPKTPAKKTDEPSAEELAKTEAKANFMKSYPMPQMPANPNEAQMELFQKAAQIIELAKTVDPMDATSVFQFHQMRKAIMEGKESDIAAVCKSDPWGFHRVSNQDLATTHKADDVKADPATCISLTAKATDVLTDAEVALIVNGVEEVKA